MRGLDGSHGVIIPRRNVKQPDGKKDVVDAVKAGKFTIYPINRAEGKALRYSQRACLAELKEDRTYPESTINYLVAKRFEEIREALKEERRKKMMMKRKERQKENNMKQTVSF